MLKYKLNLVFTYISSLKLFLELQILKPNSKIADKDTSKNVWPHDKRLVKRT